MCAVNLPQQTFYFQSNFFGYQEDENPTKKAYTENLAIYMTQRNMFFRCKTYK